MIVIKLWLFINVTKFDTFDYNAFFKSYVQKKRKVAILNFSLQDPLTVVNI